MFARSGGVGEGVGWVLGLRWGGGSRGKEYGGVEGGWKGGGRV